MAKLWHLLPWSCSQPIHLLRIQNWKIRSRRSRRSTGPRNSARNACIRFFRELKLLKWVTTAVFVKWNRLSLLSDYRIAPLWAKYWVWHFIHSKRQPKMLFKFNRCAKLKSHPQKAENSHSYSTEMLSPMIFTTFFFHAFFNGKAHVRRTFFPSIHAGQ